MIKSLMLLAALLFAMPCYAQDVPQKDKIDNLIEQLGDDNYEVREAAHIELESIGKPALSALRKAIKDEDIEIASRAEELVEKISGKRPSPESKPVPQPRTPSPDLDLPDPSDLQELLEGLGGEDQFPEEFQGILEMFKDFMDENGSGALDPQSLFEKLFGNKTPDTPKPVVSKIEQELGIKVAPLPEALRVHLNMPANQGLLVVDVTKSNKRFQKHDILNKINKSLIPPKGRDQDGWSKTATHISNIKQLELLRDSSCSIEFVRKGKVEVRNVKRIKVLTKSPQKSKSDKERDF